MGEVYLFTISAQEEKEATFWFQNHRLRHFNPFVQILCEPAGWLVGCVTWISQVWSLPLLLTVHNEREMELPYISEALVTEVNFLFLLKRTWLIPNPMFYELKFIKKPWVWETVFTREMTELVVCSRFRGHNNIECVWRFYTSIWSLREVREGGWVYSGICDFDSRDLQVAALSLLTLKALFINYDQ